MIAEIIALFARLVSFNMKKVAKSLVNILPKNITSGIMPTSWFISTIKQKRIAMGWRVRFSRRSKRGTLVGFLFIKMNKIIF